MRHEETPLELPSKPSNPGEDVPSTPYCMAVGCGSMNLPITWLFLSLFSVVVALSAMHFTCSQRLHGLRFEVIELRRTVDRMQFDRERRMIDADPK